MTERFAPVVLAAAFAEGLGQQPIAVHRVLATIAERDTRHPVAVIEALTWSELRAIIVRAVQLSNVDIRSWEARARSRGFSIMPVLRPSSMDVDARLVCIESVGDEGVGVLADRLVVSGAITDLENARTRGIVQFFRDLQGRVVA